MAATKKNQQAPPASVTPAVDPKFEWAEKEASYVLRLALPGLRKDDFRVQVDGAGRLTVRGTRPGQSSFHKVFQLPSAAGLDDIAGRFDAGVLTLTVPKHAAGAGAPTSVVEEIKRKQPGVATEENKVDKEEVGKEEDALKNKTMDEAATKARQQEGEVAPMSRKQEQEKPAPAPVKEEEDVKPKAAPQAAAAAPPQKPAPKHEGATSGENAKAAISPESLAERVRRRGEEEQRAKAAAAATAAMKAIAVPEKKATASCGGWKERVHGELKVLTDMKWADGLVETAWRNKEVVAVGIAAFSLGFLVSQKLFRK